jgi:O-antigen ligase
LLPGEIALGLGLVCILWRAARARNLPFRQDALNYGVLLWLAVGAVRLPLDVQRHGFVAVRDFAMVYYALFFFLAQEGLREPAAKKWLEGCLTFGFALTVPVFVAFVFQTEFFLQTLVLGNTPLIYVKSDVAGSFMAAGVFWFLHRYTERRQSAWLLLVALNLAGTLWCNNRAALVALTVCIGWLVVLRIGRWLRALALLASIGGLALLVEAALPHSAGNPSQVYRLYESALTMLDVSGSRTPLTTDLGDKPDNNRFRIVWWREVARETAEDGPWLGLGFGHDLAGQFLQTYYATSGEDFTTRSPHNFFLSVFARMGLLGLAVILLLLGVIAVYTRRASRHHADRLPYPAWLTVWAILTSACFGVVLEGPMGAVLFWTSLGMASATTSDAHPTHDESAESNVDPDVNLPQRASVAEIARSP